MTSKDTGTVLEVEVLEGDAIKSKELTKIEDISGNNEIPNDIEQHIDDDDDFGAFSDASFDDFEESPVAKDNSNATTSLSTESRFPQSLFDDREQLKLKLEELANIAFPVQPQVYLPQENPSILNERSQQLLQRLIGLLYLKPYNWQRSSLRKKLLITLGLPDQLETVKKNRFNTFNADDYLVKPLSDLNISEKERQDLMQNTDSILESYLIKLENDEQLQHSTDDELDVILKRYDQELNKVESLLSIWECEKTKLEEDNATFESVVENLVGHTQRLRREETLKSLKKEKDKSKRFNIFRKKK